MQELSMSFDYEWVSSRGLWTPNYGYGQQTYVLIISLLSFVNKAIKSCVLR